VVFWQICQFYNFNGTFSTGHCRYSILSDVIYQNNTIANKLEKMGK